MEQKNIAEEAQVFKIGLGEEVRRITLNGTNGYEQLRKCIEDVFDELPEKWVLQYVDDEGDLISVSTEREFQEALKIFKKLKVPSLKFGIAAKLTPVPPPTPVIQANNTSQTKSVPAPVEFISSLLQGIDISPEHKEHTSPIRKDIPKDKLDEERRKTKEFHPAMCDACNSKIPGDQIRYKCNECENFDLCELCRCTSSHNESHTFVEIKDPKLTVHRVLCGNCHNTIVGDRFKCRKCPDFDLCSSCLNIQVHKEHTFEKVEKHSARELHLNIPPQVVPFVSEFLNIFGAKLGVENFLGSPSSPAPNNNNSSVNTPSSSSSQIPISHLKQEAETTVKMEEDLKEKYQSQIAQLFEMGFMSQEENVLALQKSEGNVEQAVRILLS